VLTLVRLVFFSSRRKTIVEDKQSGSLAQWYVRAVIAVGTVVLVYSAWKLPVNKLDRQFLFIAIVTITLSSRMTVQIPRISGHISVSDTLIFLTLLLYGGEAAILVAAAEALFSSLLMRPKSVKMSTVTVVFNMAMMACSTLVTVSVLRFFFGSITSLSHGNIPSSYLMALLTMALVQYISNSGMAATHTALRRRLSIWQVWQQHYLWASITYLAGATAAGITAKIVDKVGFYSVAITTPIIVIIYLTYRVYMKNIEATAAAAKAEQAQQHIEELNRHIIRQEHMREQMMHLEKMSALGELASGVAHDFNNTLAGILGRAQLLLRTDDLAEIKRGLGLIAQTAEDGAKTVKRIQDFARQRRDLDFYPLVVDQLLLDVSEITRPRWKDRAEASNVHINLELQIRSRALVMGDASELREVLVNMVFNAVDAMPSGGTLTLSVEEVNDFVQICIGDTGVGMLPEVYSRIFDPFFTTKGKSGMGLGLAVSYGIVRRHEGFIEVSSEVGKGTTFKINLPIAEDVVMPKPEEEKSLLSEEALAIIAARTARKTKILVVDDEDHVRELLGDILKAEGCDVVLAERGTDALTILEKEKFDGMFSDVGMPGMSGWELTAAVRARDKKIPIALITGWGEIVGSNEKKEAQVDWVVAKPFDITRIAEIAREVAKRREETSIKRVA
jgi:signal transduction histidine kinase/ActR/RegA family two-component response regulator